MKFLSDNPEIVVIILVAVFSIAISFGVSIHDVLKERSRIEYCIEMAKLGKDLEMCEKLSGRSR